MGLFFFVVFFSFICLIRLESTFAGGVSTVEDMIQRVYGDKKYLSNFHLEINEEFEHYFEISRKDSKILLVASNPISLSSAFFYYLRHYANSSITLETKNIKLIFPVPEKSFIMKKAPFDNKYIFNVCTFGYTISVWNWKDWENAIDWMALHGINMPLALEGQEYLFYILFQEFGIEKADILDYFSGPHFLAWNRMSNIKRFGGPLSEEYLVSRFNLQLKVLERMRLFGMKPVLPGYNGFVPDAFVEKFKEIKYIKTHKWGGFNSSFTQSHTIDPADSFFIKIGNRFIELQMEMYNGTDHLYSVDQFNEMLPKSHDSQFLQNCSLAVWKSLQGADPDAIWILQGWAFFDQRYWWLNYRLENYLKPVPNDRMIILDFTADVVPLWKQTNSFFGKKFIWNIIVNFGGKRRFAGNAWNAISNVIKDIKDAGDNLVGIGITAEAIYVSPMIYELFLDTNYLFFEQNITIERVYEWVFWYTKNRYDDENSHFRKMWEYLLNGPYSHFTEPSVYTDVLGYLPSFSISPFIVEKDHSLVNNAFQELIQGISEIKSQVMTEGMSYDTVDVVRQVLSNLINEYFNILYAGYEKKSTSVMESASNMMRSLIKDLDELLLTNDHFLLGKWIKKSRDMGSSEKEKDQMEYNARNIISLWGFTDTANKDYARKEWNSMVGDYYYNRWDIFFNNIKNGKLDETKYTQEINEFQNNWQIDHKSYPTTKRGDTIDVVNAISEKYFKMPSNFEKKSNKDLLGGKLVKTYCENINVIAGICNAIEKCVAFNSIGNIYLKEEFRYSHSGVDLYIKKNN